MLWLVPGSVSATEATIWLRTAAAVPPHEVRIELRSESGTTLADLEPAWFAFESASSPRHFARVRVPGLRHGTLHRVRLAAPAAEAGDEAWVRTLPAVLPRRGEAPLRIFLGSCFSPQRDRGLGIRNVARELHREASPSLKILCGDQVYLDLPLTDALPTAGPAMRRELLGRYEASWAPDVDRGAAANGYGELLRRGANLFVSDDHEFWNNYPFEQIHLRSTWRDAVRTRYADAAKELFRAYQAEVGPGGDAENGLQRICIGVPGEGGLAIAALDGRYFRSRSLAHHPTALAAVRRWLGSLEGPAVVVLSQPLFQPPAAGPVRRRRADAGLADFEDFGPLVKALVEAPHDVLVLSGDIHGGRVLRTREGRIAELVSSPLALIEPGTYWDAQPVKELRDRSTSGAGKATTAVDAERYPLRANNFATLDVVRTSANALEVRAQLYEVRSDRWPRPVRDEAFRLV